MRIGELTRIVTEVDLRLIVRGAGGEGVMSMRERMGPALVNLLPVVPILVSDETSHPRVHHMHTLLRSSMAV